MDYLEKLKEVKEKYDKINEQLSDASIVTKQEKLIKLSKERANLQDIVSAYENYVKLMRDLKGNEEILEPSDDKELKELAKTELEELYEKRDSLEEKIKLLLVPKDPDDDKGVIVGLRFKSIADKINEANVRKSKFVVQVKSNYLLAA